MAGSVSKGFLSAVVLISIFDVSHQSCCKDGWVAFRGNCYLFYDQSKLSWNGAGHYCASQGSQLSTVTSREENSFLKSQIYKMFRSISSRRREGFWLGAADDFSEGSWVWYPSDAPVTFTDWAPNQPSSNQHHEEDCLMLNGATNFTWNDDLCSNLHYPICKARADSFIA